MVFDYRGQKLLKYKDMRIEITTRRIGRKWAWSCSIEILDPIEGKRLCPTEHEAVAAAESIARSVIDAGWVPTAGAGAQTAHGGVWLAPARSPKPSSARQAAAVRGPGRSA